LKPEGQRVSFFALALVLVVTAVGLGWVLTRNSLFLLSEIVVEKGNSEMDTVVREKLVRFYGQRLTRLSLREAERSLLEIPEISRVVLHKRWPSTLLVSVQLRKAVLAKFDQARLMLYDSEAKPIAPYLKAEPLPLLKGPIPRAVFEELCEFLGELPRLDQLQQIEWSRQAGLVLTRSDKEFVTELGFSDFTRAFHRAREAERVLELNDLLGSVERLDASYRSRAVARLKSSPSEMLQNPKSELNLKELVHREGEKPAAAR